jgi:predicted CXXCH cytochrome family protein
VKQGECTLCHQPHAGDEPKLLRSSSAAALCFQCHEDDVTGRAFVHAPVAKGYCLRCHDPHGAEQPKNLVVTKGQNGCLECHAQRVAPKVAHVALERYGCVACHDPHGTANPFQLLRPVNELCADCHRKQADGDHVGALGQALHPVAGAWDARRGRPFSCASCHDPHGGQNPKLFYYGTERLESCEGCHGDRSGKHPELVDLTKRARPAVDGGVPPLVPPSMLTLPGTLTPLPPAPPTPPTPPDAGVTASDGGVVGPRLTQRTSAHQPRPLPRRSAP